MNVKEIIKKLDLALSVMSLLAIVLVCAVYYFEIKYKSFAWMVLIAITLLLSLWALFRRKVERWIEMGVREANDYWIDWDVQSAFRVGKLLFWASVVLAGGTIFTALADDKSYRRLIGEDGVVEWLSVLFWLIAFCFMSLLVLRRMGQGGDRRPVYPLVLMAMFFFVCAGEEASWGQRILNIQTPEMISKINVQKETNLHNMGSISVFSNVFFLITVFFFSMLPYAAKKWQVVDGLIYRLGIVRPEEFATRIYALSLTTWVLVGLKFGTLGFHPFSFYERQYYNQMDDEYFEMMAAYSFMVYAITTFYMRPLVKQRLSN